MNAQDDELFIEQIQIGPMQNFTYLLGSNLTREVFLVDPAWEIDALLEHVQQREFEVKGALITHYHPDHCGGGMGGRKIPGVSELLERKAVKIYVHKLEADGLKRVTGISDSDLVKVESGDEVKLGNVAVEFLHTPGHTPGSQCFRCRHTLVSGDTLFIDGCGRVDLPGSDADDMFRSLRNLSSLPDDTLLLPGHNYGDIPNADMATIKRRNPYLRVADLDMFRQFMGVHDRD
jgi:hydroxyacylglutathione hydrolase